MHLQEGLGRKRLFCSLVPKNNWGLETSVLIGASTVEMLTAF